MRLLIKQTMYFDTKYHSSHVTRYHIASINLAPFLEWFLRESIPMINNKWPRTVMPSYRLRLNSPVHIIPYYMLNTSFSGKILKQRIYALSIAYKWKKSRQQLSCEFPLDVKLMNCYFSHSNLERSLSYRISQLLIHLFPAVGRVKVNVHKKVEAEKTLRILSDQAE